MTKFEEIFDAIKADKENQGFTKEGIEPLYSANENARICLIGQAPGRIAQDKKEYWDDPSGDRLRDWLGIDRQTFYTSNKLSIMPMDFYFPGKGKSGDLPPRKGFAAKWHPLLLDEMPQLELIILIGQYAQKYYLHLKSTEKITTVVRQFESYQPKYFPLVHPSPRNNIWIAKNKWFETDVLPALKKRVSEIVKD